MKLSSIARRLVPTLIAALLLVVPGVQAAFSQALKVATEPPPVLLPVTSVPLSQLSYCRPGSGWRWTYGPGRPAIAEQVGHRLHAMGIEASVQVRSFGETDSCGKFELYALDFHITVREPQVGASGRQAFVDRIRPTLAAFGKPNLGKVEITILPDKRTFTVGPVQVEPKVRSFLDAAREYDAGSAAQVFLPLATYVPRPVEPVTQQVYVVVYDPLLSNGQLLSDYLGWAEHSDMTQVAVNLFRQASHGKLNYKIVDTTVVTDGWPVKADGFQYTEAEYLSVYRGQSPAHSPDGVDYIKIVNDPQLDICGRVNRNEVDEVWIYNGPWFGFWESTLVGPDAYWYNSPPVSGPHTCKRTIPIMGPSPERPDVPGHGEGHRMEATMFRVYGSWEQNRTQHSWDRFGLVKAQSPDYTYSGCGSVHYPPNGTSGYDYSNPSVANSNCDDFYNYPDLSDPLTRLKPVTCSTYGCDHYGYMLYWFGHLPVFPGCGPDQVANDWWEYFADPVLALEPRSACR